MDCSPPGFFVPGILQARILEWVAILSSRGSSQLRDQTHISYVFWLAGGFFTTSAIWEAWRLLGYTILLEDLGCQMLETLTGHFAYFLVRSLHPAILPEIERMKGWLGHLLFTLVSSAPSPEEQFSSILGLKFVS